MGPSGDVVCPAFLLGPILCDRRLGAEVEAKSDVLLDGRREEERVLGHHADERA